MAFVSRARTKTTPPLYLPAFPYSDQPSVCYISSSPLSTTLYLFCLITFTSFLLLPFNPSSSSLLFSPPSHKHALLPFLLQVLSEVPMWARENIMELIFPNTIPTHWVFISQAPHHSSQMTQPSSLTTSSLHSFTPPSLHPLPAINLKTYIFVAWSLLVNGIWFCCVELVRFKATWLSCRHESFSVGTFIWFVLEMNILFSVCLGTKDI